MDIFLALSWEDDMDALDDEILLQADYLPELEASDTEPVLPSTNNPHPNATDIRPMISDGGQGKPCQDGGANLEPSILPPPRMEALNWSPPPPTTMRMFVNCCAPLKQ